MKTISNSRSDDLEPVVIVALGAVTPVGRDAWSSAAAVRAGIGRFVEHPWMIDVAGQPMRVACAGWLEPSLSGQARLEALLLPALGQVLEPLEAWLGRGAKIALALGLPVGPPQLAGDLLQAVAQHCPGRFATAAGFAAGNAAGHLALAATCRKLRQRDFDACVMAAVDSRLDAEHLEWLERCNRLHGAGPLNNAWGFVPGEGAGALLVMRAETARRCDADVLGQVLTQGCAHEDRCIGTETVCIGTGLTEAMRGALAGLPDGARVADVYCDLNGEPYRADEYGFAILRTGAAFESPSSFVAPADCWGDVGAASGPLHVVLAAVAGRKGYAKGAVSMVWASSDSGERAALLLATGRRS